VDAGMGIGGGNEGVVGGNGWEPERPSLSEVWAETTVGWTDERAERLFQGIMTKLETRRRRRRAVRLAITCAGLAVTVMVGLGLVGFGVNGPFAHLWTRVHQGWWPAT
jgi:hypothetical protein